MTCTYNATSLYISRIHNWLPYPLEEQQGHIGVFQRLLYQRYCLKWLIFDVGAYFCVYLPEN